MLQTMGCFGSKDKLSKEDMDFLKSHTRYDEATIKEWYKGFKVSNLYICTIYLLLCCAFGNCLLRILGRWNAFRHNSAGLQLPAIQLSHFWILDIGATSITSEIGLFLCKIKRLSNCGSSQSSCDKAFPNITLLELTLFRLTFLAAPTAYGKMQRHL